MTLPDSITEIKSNAFYNCYALAEIDLPDSLSILASCAFQNCYALEEIDLPDSLTSIDRYAFYDCNALELLRVGCDSYARTWAEANGYPLDEGQTGRRYAPIHRGEEVPGTALAPTETEAGHTAGTVCAACGDALTAPRPIPALDELDLLVLPADLTAIADQAFTGGAFQGVIVPDGCASIGAEAFAACPNLVYVRVPAGVILAADAFADCDDLLVERR